MRWLGERSYGIYLIHLGLMTHVLARIGHDYGVKETFVLLLIGVTAATLIAADLLWRFVERPALERRLPWRQAEFSGRPMLGARPVPRAEPGAPVEDAGAGEAVAPAGAAN
jgi:peptidoglycan/LPS O-acetylase OafA/YrhL